MNPPVISAYLLYKAIGSNTTTFEQAGLLARVQTGSACNTVYAQDRLTAAGEALAVKNGWPIVYGTLLIPAGTFEYVPHSAGRSSKDFGKLEFRIRFVPNNNVPRLLALAPAHAWHLDTPLDSPLDLSDAGRIISVQLTLPIQTIYNVTCGEQRTAPGPTPDAQPVETPGEYGRAATAAVFVNIDSNTSYTSDLKRVLQALGIIDQTGMLTDKGTRISQSGNWIVDGGLSLIAIPVGRLYDTPEQAAAWDKPRTHDVAFKGNSNARYLSSIAPPTAWPIWGFPGANQVTLANVGTTIRTTFREMRIPEDSLFFTGGPPDPPWMTQP